MAGRIRTRTSPSSARSPRSPTSSASTSSCATPAAATSRASARSTTRSRRRFRVARARAVPLLRLRRGRRRDPVRPATSSTSTSPRPSSGWPPAAASSCATSRAAPPAPPSRGQRARLVDAHTPRPRRSTPSSCAPPEARRRASSCRARLRRGGRARGSAAATRPSGWDALTKHLLAAGSPRRSSTLAGLSRESGRGGLIDRFHRRLLWPIRDVGGDVVGFGARRLFDDDRVEAKYLNTPETPIYKKSQLLYGVDMAKQEIARQHRAVDRRGLHRRDGLPPGRRHDRGGDLRHRVRRRARRR